MRVTKMASESENSTPKLIKDPQWGPRDGCVKRQDTGGAAPAVENEMTKELLASSPFPPARSVPLLRCSLLQSLVPGVIWVVGPRIEGETRRARKICSSFPSESDYSGTIDHLALFVHRFCY